MLRTPCSPRTVEVCRWWHAAIIIAAAVFVGGWVGAVVANRISGPYLRLAFGVFVVVLGLYVMVGTFRHLKRI